MHTRISHRGARRSLLWRAHDNEIGTVTLRYPSPRLHLGPDRAIGHVAMVRVGSIAEHPVDRRGVCRTRSRYRKKHVHELRVLQDELGMPLAGPIALDGAATEEMRITLRGRDVEAAHRRGTSLCGGAGIERRARAHPSRRGMASVKKRLLSQAPGDEVMVQGRVVILDDRDRRVTAVEEFRAGGGTATGIARSHQYLTVREQGRCVTTAGCIQAAADVPASGSR